MLLCRRLYDISKLPFDLNEWISILFEVYNAIHRKWLTIVSRSNAQAYIFVVIKGQPHIQLCTKLCTCLPHVGIFFSLVWWQFAQVLRTFVIASPNAWISGLASSFSPITWDLTSGGGCFLKWDCANTLSIRDTSPGRRDGTKLSPVTWKIGTFGSVGGSKDARKSGWRPCLSVV